MVIIIKKIKNIMKNKNINDIPLEFHRIQCTSNPSKVRTVFGERIDVLNWFPHGIFLQIKKKKKEK